MTGNNIRGLRVSDFAFFKLLFLFSCFFPIFDKQLGSSGAILLNACLIVFLSILLIPLFKYGNILFLSGVHKHVYTRYVFLILGFLLLIVISMFVGIVFGGVNITQRDFFEFHRPLLTFLVFSFSYFVFCERSALKKMESLLVLSFFIIFAFSILQTLKVGSEVLSLYTKPTNIRSTRLSAPFVNPYDYAFIMTLFFYYFAIKALYRNLIYIFLCGLALILIFLTQSRAIAVGLLVSFFLIFPFFVFFTSVRFKAKIIKHSLLYFSLFSISFILLLVMLIPFIQEHFRYMASAFERLLEGEAVNSANVRKEQLFFAMEKAKLSAMILFFGNGPAKDEMEHVETIYTYLFYRYGLLGIFLYFSIWVMSLYQAFRVIVNKGYNSEVFVLLSSIFMWIITVPLVSIGNNLTEQVRSSFVFYACLGLVAATYSSCFNKGGNK